MLVKHIYFRKKLNILVIWPVSAEGVKLIPSYVQKITEWPLPQTGKELSAFLGFTNYYHDFLPGFENVTAELNSVKNNRSIVWTPEMINNFNTLKQMFAAAPCRATPDFSPTAKPFILTIDFSKTAVLSQEQDNIEKFLGFKGQKCRNYESNYHSSKGELLALTYGLTKFEPLLRLNQFIVVTDSTTVLHWSTNINADLISRATHMDDPPPLIKIQLHKVTKTCSPCPGNNYRLVKSQI